MEVNENVSQILVAVQDVTEMSNNIQNINQNAIELSKLAEELTGLVSVFNVTWQSANHAVLKKK